MQWTLYLELTRDRVVINLKFSRDYPSGQNRQITVSRSAFLLIRLKIQCHIVKNTFQQTAFAAIFPTVIEHRFEMMRDWRG